MKQTSPLLLVANDTDTANTINKMATEMAFSVTEANYTIFNETYYAVNPNIIILDIVTDDMAGFEVLKFLQDRNSKAIILLLSGRQDWYIKLGSFNEGSETEYSRRVAQAI